MVKATDLNFLPVSVSFVSAGSNPAGVVFFFADFCNRDGGWAFLLATALLSTCLESSAYYIFWRGTGSFKHGVEMILNPDYSGTEALEIRGIDRL